MNKKALIAMSGGVDSSVTAYLVKQSGYECMGATMSLYHGSDIDISENNSCTTSQDIMDAEHIANRLGIPFSVFNFSTRFKECVIDKFVSAYENGMTPNPCIECNRHLKFEELFSRSRELGYDFIATGHYARINQNEMTGRYELKKASDTAKDQSYVLYSLTQEQLSHALFPLGSMTKAEVRALAEENGFINAKKSDSQDICFIPDGRYADFIEKYIGKTYPEGNFIDTAGNILGTHRGIIRYTIGQRKGLGLSFPQPMYVSHVDPFTNTVTLARHEELFSRSLTAKNINLISVSEINKPMRIKAKARYRHKEQWATVTQIDSDTIHVEFDEPQRAITKGQSVVLYDDDIVVGGGVICGA